MSFLDQCVIVWECKTYMNNTRECLQSLIDSKVWFVMEESATALARIGHAVEVIEILDLMRACHSCFHQGSCMLTFI